ncbi:MAG: LysM domain-containing protein, partial [Sphingobacteriia bacterium]|nr:LysM domain-containing protein [Sphingobacteriia bacterium]
MVKVKMIYKIIISLLIITNVVIAATSIRDSVGVRKVGDKSYILHKVEKGETLFGLQRKYKIPVDQLRSANPGKPDALNVGTIYLVPLTPVANHPTEIVQETPTSHPKSDSIPPTTITSPTPDPGLGILSTLPPAERLLTSTEENIKPNYLDSSAIVTYRKDLRGTPAWYVVWPGKIEVITDSRIVEEPMYGLHRDLPEGTLIKVVNPMNEKFVLVKTLR